MVAPDEWTYTLDENERAAIVATAESRTSTNRKRGTQDNMVGKKRTKEQEEATGMAGELIFGKFANMFVDLRTDAGPQKADFFARDGSTIDIKATHYPNGKLIVPLWKMKDPCDWYGLVICDWQDLSLCPTGRFVGGVHRLAIMDKKALKKPDGRTVSFVMEQDQLLPPGDFIELVNRLPS